MRHRIILINWSREVATPLVVMQQIKELEGLPKRASSTSNNSSTEPETYVEVKGVNDTTEPQGSLMFIPSTIIICCTVVLTTRNPNPILDSYYKRVNEQVDTVIVKNSCCSF